MQKSNVLCITVIDINIVGFNLNNREKIELLQI
jgi:hypothetical protein